MNALDLARWQFGIVTVYHFLFMPLTIGRPPLERGVIQRAMKSPQSARSALLFAVVSLPVRMTSRRHDVTSSARSSSFCATQRAWSGVSPTVTWGELGTLTQGPISRPMRPAWW
jgi:hypothetical protein